MNEPVSLRWSPSRNPVPVSAGVLSLVCDCVDFISVAAGPNFISHINAVSFLERNEVVEPA
jgi:hypothetical protein